MILEFVVPGEPAAKARARAAPVKRNGRFVFGRGGKPLIRHYTPAKTASFESSVRMLCRFAANRARWRFTLKQCARPDGVRFKLELAIFRKHEGAGGDIDNYLKAALDGCNGIAFPDDRYVRAIVVDLQQDARSPRMEVALSVLGTEP